MGVQNEVTPSDKFALIFKSPIEMGVQNDIDFLEGILNHLYKRVFKMRAILKKECLNHIKRWMFKMRGRPDRFHKRNFRNHL